MREIINTDMNVISKSITKHSIEQLTSPKINVGSNEGMVLSPSKKVKSEPTGTYPELKKIASNEKIVSYTEMIARAIFSCPNNMSTLQDIYNFLSVKYPILQNRGKSWKNSVRHTLSLNEWFVKIPRMDNGKCCYWSVHPVYLQRFKKGDFQKQRKSNACKLRNAARTLEELQINLNNPYHIGSYYPTDMSNNFYHNLPSWPVCRNMDSMQQPYYNVSATAGHPSHLPYAQTSSLNVLSHIENPMGSMMTSYLKPDKVGIANCIELCRPYAENFDIACNRSTPNPESTYNHRNVHENIRYNGPFSPNMQTNQTTDMLSHQPTNELIGLQMQMRMENSM